MDILFIKKEIDMVGFFIAMLSGACMSIQGVFNTQVTKQTNSEWVTNVFVQLSAFVVCFFVWLITDRSSFAELFKVEPKYMLLGGSIGVVITFTVIKSMSMLGPAKAVMVIVVTQLLIAYLIEVIGLFGVEKQPLEWKKIVALALSIGGIILFKS